MNDTGIILAIVAVVAVAVTDIIVRLRIAPRRRDKFVEELLESMTEPEPNLQGEAQASTQMDVSLLETLLRYFELSATSRQILAALAHRTDGLSEPELLSAVNHGLAARGRRELPAGVVRKIVSLLLRADLTELRQGKLELTNVGRHLHTILQAPSTTERQALFLRRADLAMH